MKAMLCVWAGVCLVLALAAPAAGEEMGPMRRAYREGLMQNRAEGVIREQTNKIESGGLSPQALAEAYYRRGAAWCQMDKPERGLADLNQAIETRPDFRQAYFARGELYMRGGRLPQAVADYEKVIQMAPDFAGAYNDRGRALRKMGKLKEAKADFDQAIALDNDRRAVAFALHNRGNLLADTGHFKEALADYDRSHALGNQGPGLLFRRGLARLADGQAAAAEADLLQVCKKAPGNDTAFLALGHALVAQDRGAEALPAYNRAVSLDKESMAAVYNRGVYFFSQGQFAPAAQDFEAAFKRADEKLRGQCLVWWYLALERQGKSGQDLLKRNAQAQPSDQVIADALAYYRDKNDFKQLLMGTNNRKGLPAEEAARRVFFLAQGHLMMNQTHQARAYLRQCLKLGQPVSYECQVARAELARLDHGQGAVGEDKTPPKRKRPRAKKQQAED